MIRVKNKYDSTTILFSADENNNISIEKDTKSGSKYYYYYDAKNRLTFEVRGPGEIVAVDNVIPGAWVFVRQTPPGLMSPEYPIGKAKAIGSSVVVQVYPILRTDPFVTAHQEVGGKPSGPAPWVRVESKAEFPPPTPAGGPHPGVVERRDLLRRLAELRAKRPRLGHDIEHAAPQRLLAITCARSQAP
jgi:hypothetical protein